MGWLTPTLAAVLLVTAIAGWRAGLIKRVLELAGLSAAVMLASHFGSDAGLALEEATGMPRTMAVAAGWLVVIAVGFLVAKLLAWGVSKVVGLTILGWVDRTGGALFGLGVGALICSVLLVLAAAAPGNDALRDAIEGEPLPRTVRGVAPALWGLVNGDDGKLERLMEDARDSAGELGRDAASKAAGIRDGDGS